MSILDEIFANKRREVARQKTLLSASALAALAAQTPPPPEFLPHLSPPPNDRRIDKGLPRLIAEIKHRSPSKGILVSNFDPLALARLYAQNGAAAISVLTDETYFGGSLDHLRAVANLQTGIPLLRKDFIFDDYQILQARAAGAGAILLIVAMLSPQQLRDLLQTTAALGLRALVETHTAEEIETALAAGAPIIGVNNRNLHTFTTDLQTCIRLRPLVPPEIPYVAESGIHTAAHVAQLRAANIHAMLIGESIVTAPDPAKHIHSLLA